MAFRTREGNCGAKGLQGSGHLPSTSTVPALCLVLEQKHLPPCAVSPRAAPPWGQSPPAPSPHTRSRATRQPSHWEAQARREGRQSCATALLLGVMHALPAPSTGWELARLPAGETEAHGAWSHSSHGNALSLPPTLVGYVGIWDGPHPATIPLPRACTQLPTQACHPAERGREGQA